MKNPKISLRVNKEADTKNALFFTKYNLKENPEFIRWFLPGELHHILNKKYSQKERNRILKKIINDAFGNKNRALKKAVIKAQKDWKLIEKKYFDLVNKIFKNHPWPKGKYLGFISLFCMYPRNIKERTFFFPFHHVVPKFSNTVIAHELLHFIFFDYLKTKYRLLENSEIKGKKSNYIWQISEIFNSVIENWEPYYEIFKVKSLKQKPYTGHQYFLRMKNQWGNHQDIDYLLDQWFTK